MAAEAALKTSGATDTRQRLIEVAAQLFSRHSFAGSSLQMIADELGVTKAAVYHHFRSREELLTAVADPLLKQLRAALEEAEAQRTPHARAEWMLTGFASLAVRNRTLVGVLAADPTVIEMLRSQGDLEDLINRQVALLAAVAPGPAGQVNAALVLAGIAGTVGSTGTDLSEDTLLHYLVEAGRRTLGLRAPRRKPA
jgi:AcrR family transcriptional regulator